MTIQATRAPRRHLEESEIVDRTPSCPVCGSGSPRGPAFRLQANPDVHMLVCGRCHAASASHMPTADVLERYYATYYDAREGEVTFSAPRRFARHVVRLLPEAPLGEPVRILDYGGGDGTLAKATAARLIEMRRARAARIQVVDFPPRAAVEDGAISVRHQRPDAPIPGQYDLVLASAILEHIPELGAILPKLHNAMAPGGFFYARTPYALPLTRLFPRLDLTYPAHVHDMGSEFWNRFPGTFGWDVRVVVSRPSVVAGSLASDPLRTLAAIALKAPGHIENWLSPRSRVRRVWNVVGGWEIVLQKR